MKFLVDAHLPPGLCGLLRAAGHDAIHTSALPAANRTPDEAINQLSERGQRVVITKDTDFYHSHVLFGRPPKLLLIRTGNIGTRELKITGPTPPPHDCRGARYTLPARTRSCRTASAGLKRPTALAGLRLGLCSERGVHAAGGSRCKRTIERPFPHRRLKNFSVSDEVGSWPGERRERTPELQFAFPPVATRNGLPHPPTEARL